MDTRPVENNRDRTAYLGISCDTVRVRIRIRVRISVRVRFWVRVRVRVSTRGMVSTRVKVRVRVVVMVRVGVRIRVQHAGHLERQGKWSTVPYTTIYNPSRSWG